MSSLAASSSDVGSAPEECFSMFKDTDNFDSECGGTELRAKETDTQQWRSPQIEHVVWGHSVAIRKGLAHAPNHCIILRDSDDSADDAEEVEDDGGADGCHTPRPANEQEAELHVPQQNKRRGRLSQGQKTRLRQQMARLMVEIESNPCVDVESFALPVCVTRDPRMLKLMRRKLRKHQEAVAGKSLFSESLYGSRE